MASFGRAKRHSTANMLDIDAIYPAQFFDTVLFNGILDFGINTPEEKLGAFEVMAKVSKPGARLLVGWNRDHGPDSLRDGFAKAWFVHKALPDFPARYLVDGCDHVFDFYERR